MGVVTRNLATEKEQKDAKAAKDKLKAYVNMFE
mgnify:CR=1 FL=1